MKTRFAELDYEKHARDLWRIVDASTGAAIGPQYKSKAELLADLERYATDYGRNGARRARDLEEHPLDRAEREDREDRSAGDPRIEDHAFNPRNGSAGEY